MRRFSLQPLPRKQARSFSFHVLLLADSFRVLDWNVFHEPRADSTPRHKDSAELQVARWAVRRHDCLIFATVQPHAWHPAAPLWPRPYHTHNRTTQGAYLALRSSYTTCNHCGVIPKQRLQQQQSSVSGCLHPAAERRMLSHSVVAT